MIVDHEDTTSIDNAVAFRIHRLARLLRYHLQSFLADGLTPEQWFVLFRLYEREGLPQAELADKILNDRPNITRIVDKLQNKQLVVRAANPDDRRSYRIYLSREGRQLIEQIFPLMIEQRKQIFRGISEEDLESFVEVIDRIEENLT